MEPLKHLSDSEDDEDYIPPADKDPSSDSEDVPEAEQSKTLGTGHNGGSKDMKAIWESFEASIPGASSSLPSRTDAKLLKVVKRYRFAGKEHEEIIEVQEGSKEAQQWPLYQDSSSSKDVELSSASAPPLESANQPEAEPPKQEPTKRRPGPRKPKTTLAPLPGTSKAKKITTLEKSAMDWKAHLDSQKQTEERDEVEANRRGGGYLERVEFLKRVEDRKEEKLDAERSTKRRKL